MSGTLWNVVYCHVEKRGIQKDGTVESVAGNDQWEISRIQYMEVRKRTICLSIFWGDIP